MITFGHNDGREAPFCSPNESFFGSYEEEYSNDE
jgi:hypothetical protein